MSRLRFILSVVAISTYLVTINVDGFKDMANFSKYEDVRGDIRKNNLRAKTCRNVKLWIIHRHGTRLPMSDEIKQIQSLIFLKDTVLENHKHGKGNLTRAELNRLKSWTFDASIEATPAYLTESGANETRRTAMRFKEKFPELLDVKYSNETFYIRHSDTQRTTATTNAFVDALFGENAHQDMDIKVEARDKDFLLYPFVACKKLSAIYDDMDTDKHSNDFGFFNSKEYKKGLKILSHHLGIEVTLGVDTLIAIYNICGYNSAWDQETEYTGPWCAALGETTLKLGEYYWDLVYETYCGYQSEITKIAGCGLVKDIWYRFSKAVQESDLSEPITIIFGHDDNIMSMHSTLGLLKDDPILTHNNFEKQGNRKWRTQITPFAANVAILLQNCEQPGGDTEFEVMLFRNENPMTDVETCPNGICTWENFKGLFEQPAKQQCNNYQYIC